MWRVKLCLWGISCVELLPPANEVWGKVMFSEAYVSHFVHRETPLAANEAGGTHPNGMQHTCLQYKHSYRHLSESFIHFITEHVIHSIFFRSSTKLIMLVDLSILCFNYIFLNRGNKRKDLVGRNANFVFLVI